MCTYLHSPFRRFPGVSTHIRTLKVVQLGALANKGSGRGERIRDAEEHGSGDDHGQFKVRMYDKI